MDLYQDNRSPVGLDPPGFIVVLQRRKEGLEDLGREKANYLRLYPPAMLHLRGRPACSLNFSENGMEAAVLMAVSPSLITPKHHRTPEAASPSRTAIWNEKTTTLE